MKSLKPPIENKIYASLILACEEMEFEGKYKGNGHHLAQTLTNLVSVGLLPKEERKLYDVLTDKPQSTREIALKVGRNTKIVSSALMTIQKKTLLVSSTIENKRRLWCLKNNSLK